MDSYILFLNMNYMPIVALLSTGTVQFFKPENQLKILKLAWIFNKQEGENEEIYYYIKSNVERIIT